MKSKVRQSTSSVLSLIETGNEKGNTQDIAAIA